MAVEITYTAVCRNNQLFIFDGLSEDESQTGRRLHEDVTDFSNSMGRYNYCTRYVVKSRVMLVAHLKAIENECKAGVLLPALHFECHGDEKKGLWIASSNEYIPWQDLASLIAPVNAATRNNVSVILASCESFKLCESVDIKLPCPFHFMIAPNQEIEAGTTQDSLLPFYKEIVSTGELNKALTHLDSRFKRFIAGEWFYVRIADFYTNHYSAKDKQEIMNQMIDNEVRKAGYSNRQLIRSIRPQIKRSLSDPKEFYQTVERRFFHGQKYVPYADMRRFIDDQKVSK
ncbi:hypothetical protein ACA40_11445 [Pseudomonas syringae pv. lapsa]|jgi:hypothetical protein|uniref:hypothetical protein n=1 Tax=Pseudomonas syringae TaxID=317 RepID=UPI00070B919D|nr:hypothetical protein [Pseudomonas syringae]ALU60444.1 hypothetical protein ACA40_11445 [Pseudomonas syringae pv. lapsa]